MKVYIAHVNKGGVADILSRLLSNSNDDLLWVLSDNSFFHNIKFIFTVNYERIEFHQPRSFIYALISAFIRPSSLMKRSLILHESSFFSADFSSIYFSIRSLFFIFLRVTLVWLNLLSFSKIYSVSNYVSSSYFRNFDIISYINLFRDELSLFYVKQFTSKKNQVVVWIRPNTSDAAHFYLSQLREKFNILHVYILGDNVEVSILVSKMRNNVNTADMIVCNNENLLPIHEFQDLLNNSKFFISPYSKEAYGLSVFFAMYFGSIVVCPPVGGYLDWLPKSNLEAFDRDMSSIELCLISSENHAKGLSVLNLKCEI